MIRDTAHFEEKDRDGLCCLWHSFHSQGQGSGLWPSTWQRGGPPQAGEEPQNHRHRQRRADTLDGPGIVRGPGNAAWTETSALAEHIFNSSFG